MSNASGWVTYKEIVDNLMLAWGDSSDPGQVMRILNFVIEGYEKLRLLHMPATKTTSVTIDGEMRCVALPDDFMKFVSIGVFANGVFYEFQPKHNMLPVSTSDCGIEERDIEDQDTAVRFTGYYSIDLENRRIIIEAPVSLTTLTLNYTPSGIVLDGETYIPRMARTTVRAYAEWHMVLRSKEHSAADRVLFEKEYLKELNLFRGTQLNADALMNEYYEHIATGKQY